MTAASFAPRIDLDLEFSNVDAPTIARHIHTAADDALGRKRYGFMSVRWKVIQVW